MQTTKQFLLSRDGSMECKHIPTDKYHADIETKALPEQTYIAHEDAIHNGVFSFVESTEVVVLVGKEDVKLSQVARECRQTRPQVPRDQSNDSDLMKKVRFADDLNGRPSKVNGRVNWTDWQKVESSSLSTQN